MIAIKNIAIIDYITGFDFIGFIPESVKEVIYINQVTLNDVFCILFIVFEILSILKNMVLCKLPIPFKLQQVLERILQEYTNEIKNWRGGTTNWWIEQIKYLKK